MSTELERELKRTTKLRNFRYGLHDFVAQVGGVEALRKHNDNYQAKSLKKGLLDLKTKELLITIALVAMRDRISHIQVHMHAAHKAGASPEEILEALEEVGHNIGGAAKIGGLEAWRANFRPDIPSIDRVAELA